MTGLAKAMSAFSLLVVSLGLLAVAPSSSAACSNDQFRQGAGAKLADCRAYEQVSPVEKNSLDVSDESAAPISLSGDSVLFASAGAFAGYPTGGGALGAGNFYYGHRVGDRWSTVPATPRPTDTSRERRIFAVASDLSATLIFTYEHGFVPDPKPPLGSSNFYLHDNRAGTTRLLVNAPETTPMRFAGSTDLGHVGLTTRKVLVSDAGVPEFTYKVYDIAEDGSIELVSRQPVTDLPFTEDATLAGYGADGSPFGGGSPHDVGAVSADGSKVFFETPSSGEVGPDQPTSKIYRRSNGETELASPSQRTVMDPLGPRQKVFRKATPDGNRLFFTSPELLTDDANTGPTRAGSDLYRYDMVTDQLVDVSATAGGDGARVQGVLGASVDGNRVYYVALGEVVAGGTADQPNVYLWEDDGSVGGDTRFVTTLAPEDSRNWATGPGAKESRSTSDGRYLVLTSRASLTGYANAGTTQIYRYDAEAVGGAGQLQCVSCSPDAAPPAGSDLPSGAAAPRILSEDGRYVFFNSDDALVASDTNGVTDAYAWSAGTVSLLSTGTSPSVSTVFGSNTDGTRAFFTTREPLVPQDVDHNVDVYVAAIDGGLLSQQAIQQPSCAGEGCRGGGTSPPGAQPLLTPSFRGPGNAGSRSRACGKDKRRVKARNGKTRCVKRSEHRKHKRAGSKSRGASR